MKSVYLDQWVWINLAKAAAGRKDGKDLLSTLHNIRTAVETQSARFPLSTSHYEEMQKVSNVDQRRSLGKLMLELSQGNRMISLDERIIEYEFETALHKKFGVPESPKEVQIFGYGIGFVYGNPMVGRILRKDGTPVENLDDSLQQFEVWANQLAEEWLLCGPPKGVSVPDYEPRVAQKFAEKFFEEESDQALRFKSRGTTSERMKRVLLAREWVRLGPFAFNALKRSGIDMEWFLSHDKTFLTEFIEDMPVLHTSFYMRSLQHQNPQRKWATNDFFDIAALSVAVVHCDVVVTEKHWAHVLRQLKLDRKFGTVVVDKIPDLNEHITNV